MSAPELVSREAVTRWLPSRGAGRPAAGLPLYCLPHAGAGASAYRSWAGALPGLDVVPVQLPGRETRFREAPHERMGPLVAELADAIVADVAGRADQRFAVYGHSLGALVAFELVRELRRRRAPQPVHLFVSGHVAPQCTGFDGPPLADLPLPQFLDVLRTLGGTPDALLDDPLFVGLLVPAMRADFAVKESTVHQPEPPLDVPITALPSTEDPRAARSLVAAWREQTTALFRMHTFLGGHFAVFEQPELTHEYIAEALRAEV